METKKEVKDLKIKINFAPVLSTEEGRNVFEYLYGLERKKSTYIATAIICYINKKDDESIGVIDIIESIRHIITTYNIQTLEDVKTLLSAHYDKPIKTEHKRSMFSLQFSKKDPEHQKVYDILVNLKDSSQRAGLITKAVKYYQAANHDPIARAHKASEAIYVLSSYYQKGNDLIKNHIEECLYKFVVTFSDIGNPTSDNISNMDMDNWAV
jgi:hypothetical protein